MTAREIIARWAQKPLSESRQRLLGRLATEINRNRDQKHRKLGPHRPDAAAYMDAHSIPKPTF